MKKLCCLIFLCLCLSAQAQQYRLRYSTDENRPLSLENVIRLSLENSYDLLLIEQDLIISQQRIQEAKFLYFPRVSLNGSATAYNLDYPIILPEMIGQRILWPDDNKRDLFYGVGITAVQYIYGGGRISSTLDLARASSKETQSRYQTAKNTVIYAAKKAFYEYLYEQEKSKFSDDVLNQARKIARAKELSPSQKILVSAELSSFESLASKAHADLNKAKINLLKVLNKETNSEVAFEGSLDYNPIEVDLKKLNLWAMEFRPEVKSAMYKVEMDNIAVKLSLTRSYPDILLGASYDRQGVDNLKQENMQVSLAVKLPIGYDYSTQVKQKRAEQRQTVLRQAAVEDTVRMQVLEAYNNLIFWQTETPNRIKTWETIKTQFKDFMKGQYPLKDTFESLTYYYQAGVKTLEAQKEHLVSIANLENAVGKDLK